MYEWHTVCLSPYWGFTVSVLCLTFIVAEEFRLSFVMVIVSSMYCLSLSDAAALTLFWGPVLSEQKLTGRPFFWIIWLTQLWERHLVKDRLFSSCSWAKGLVVYGLCLILNSRGLYFWLAWFAAPCGERKSWFLLLLFSSDFFSSIA